MKRILFSLIFFLFIIIANCEVISGGEYYIDFDPGFGNGNSLSGGFYENIVENATSIININNLSPGCHWIYVRFKNSANQWGKTSSILITVSNPSSKRIIAAEYYIDIDPGQGYGTPLSGTFGHSYLIVSESFAIPTYLSEGCHWLYIRFKDSTGCWSNVEASLLTINGNTGKNIIAAEYFWNNDPGEGNGNQLQGNFNSSYSLISSFNIDTTGLQTGCHWLYVRFKDNRGQWGNPQATLVTISNDTTKTIIAAEYFWDADPGFGNAIFLSGSTIGNNYIINQNIATTDLSPGCHILYLRFKDSNNQWSKASAQLITISQPNNLVITAAEYFFDVDIGEGLGIPFTGNFNSSSVMISAIKSTTALSYGYHNLYVRFRDSEGYWGETTSYELIIGNQLLWNEDFNTYNSVSYYVNGNAYYSTEEQNFVLTTPQTYINGRIFNTTQFYLDQFIAEFDFLIGGGTGAEGIILAWVPEYNYATSNGGSLDFNNTNGYAVEFDTYTNTNDISEEHIGLIFNKATNHLAQVSLPNNTIEDNTWHHTKIDFNRGKLLVYLDNILYLVYNIQDYIPFYGYFGITGSTGAQTNYHMIDNINIRQISPTNNKFISGYCLDKLGYPVSGVTIRGYFNEVESSLSNEDGFYTITIPDGFSGSLVAEKIGWDFYPNRRYYENVSTNLQNQNFEGKLVPPIISIHEINNNAECVLSHQAGAEVQIRYLINSNVIPSYATGNIYRNPLSLQINSTIKAVAYIPQREGTTSEINWDFYTPSNYYDTQLSFECVMDESPIDITSFKFYITNTFNNIIGDYTDTNEVTLTTPNFLYLSKSQLNEWLRNPTRKICKIEYLNGNNVIGHNEFFYSADDLNYKDLKLSCRVIIGKIHIPYKNGWTYYKPGEHMAALLIKPNTIHTNLQPLLLVHGIGGSYPSFSDEFIGALNGNESFEDDMFDIWQIYYPYDQQIEESAGLLNKTLAYIKSHNYGLSSNPKNVGIIAHSMGGLVTRALIQNLNAENNYENNIWKVVMLGTPNHGSHSCYRLLHKNLSNISTSAINWIFSRQDSDSPAMAQMQPGSIFLINLNSNSPNLLQTGSSLKKDYLVIAGTKNYTAGNYVLYDREYFPENGYEDLVVSVPSASLLEYGIPLATINKTHTQLVGDNDAFNSFCLRYFFTDEYNPDINSPSYLNFLSYLDGYYYDINTIRKNDENLPDDKQGIYTLSFTNKLKTKKIKLEVNDNILGLVLDEHNIIQESDTTLPCFSDRNNIYVPLLSNNYFNQVDTIATGSTYFLEKETLFSTPFGPIFKYGLGMQLPSGRYPIVLKKRNKWPLFRAVPFKEINPVYLHSFVNNDIFITLSPAEQFIANVSNQLPYFNNRIVKNSNRTYSQKEFYVDAKVDSMIFFLSGAEGDLNFANHGACLIDPHNVVIDSIAAQQSSTMDYQSSTSSGFAYYYIENPIPGIWKLLYNYTLPDTTCSLLINSTMPLTINIPDSLLLVNRPVEVNFMISNQVGLQNPVVSASIVNISNSPNNIEPIIVSQVNDFLTFRGTFIPLEPGTYRIDAQFSCQILGETIYRNESIIIDIRSLDVVNPISPENGALLDHNSVQFSWSQTIGAISYVVLLWNDNVGDCRYIQAGQDTSIVVEDLNPGTQYWWKISAYDSEQNISYSETYSFITLTPCPMIITPENLSIGLPQYVTIEWNPIPSADYYHLQVSLDEQFNKIVLSDSLCIEVLYPLSALSSSTTYFIRIRSSNNCIYGRWSTVVSFTTRNFTIGFPNIVETQEDIPLELFLPLYIDNYETSVYSLQISQSFNLLCSIDSNYLTLTPQPEWSGEELIQITISDERLLRNRIVQIDTILVIVNRVDDPPVINLPDSLVCYSGHPTILSLMPYVNDIDTDFGDISFTVAPSEHFESSVVNGTLTITPIGTWIGREFIWIKAESNTCRFLSPRLLREDKSASASDSILIIIAYGKPYNLTLQINEQLTLSWYEIPGCYSYKVYASNLPNGGFTDITDQGTISIERNKIIWQSELPLIYCNFFYVTAIWSEREERIKTNVRIIKP